MPETPGREEEDVGGEAPEKKLLLLAVSGATC